MLPYNAHRKERGFTLTEMLVTAIIGSILMAVATPNFLSLFNNSKVKSALEQVQGALTEAQRQAMRRGKSCTITLDTTNKKIKITPSSDSEGCLLSDRTLPDGVVMTTNISSSNIKFSHKGNTTLSDKGVVVLSIANGSGEKRCLTVSTTLGAMRTGTYDGNPSSPTSDDCNFD